MKDSRKKKIRQYRRMLHASYGPSLHCLYKKIHNITGYGWLHDDNWNYYLNWMRETAKAKTIHSRRWGVPSRFRRERNREIRAKQKAELRTAFLKDDWDDFILPVNRKDVVWLYH